MRLEDFDYDLPDELIAQHPPARREDARLLVVERASGRLVDQRVSDLPAWLRAGDALALNETRVRPARRDVRRASGGRVELLFRKNMQRFMSLDDRGAPGGPPPGSDFGPTDLEGCGYHEDDVPFD